MEDEKEKRTLEHNLLRDNMDVQNSKFNDLIIQEADKLNENVNGMAKALEDAKGGNEEELAHLKKALNDEIQTRAEENTLLNSTFTNRLGELRVKTQGIEDTLDTENTIRKQEAIDLKDRLEREKKELQEYIEKDNATLREKLDRENQAIKEKIQKENEERKKENENLHDKLQADNENMQAKINGESKRLKSTEHW